MRVVGIQGHQHPIDTIGMATHLLDDLGVDRGSLNQLHLEAQGMLIEGFAVVGADININSDDFAGGLPRIQPFHHIQKAKHGSGQNK